MNLGTFIKALESLPIENEIFFDFPSSNYPTTFASYRGFYDQLALGHEDYRFDIPLWMPPTVGRILHEAQEAVNGTFTGWWREGGKFRMTESTKLWVNNRGEFHSIAIVGVETDYRTIIHTRWEDN